jgi:hypothetical protein
MKPESTALCNDTIPGAFITDLWMSRKAGDENIRSISRATTETASLSCSHTNTFLFSGCGYFYFKLLFEENINHRIV